MAAQCPHCHAELPDEASFCGACGRRITGWSALPSSTQPGSAVEALPGSHEATRQMEPTPSLLRIARLTREQRAAARAQKAAPVPSDSELLRSVTRSRAPMFVAMALVALFGALGGFAIMKRQHRVTADDEPIVTPAIAPPPSATSPIAQPPLVQPAPATGVAIVPATPQPIAPASKQAKPKLTAQSRAHRLTPLEVPIAQKPMKMPKGNGLPHKAVSTDSRPANAVNSKPLPNSEIQDPYPTVQLTPQVTTPQPPPQQQLAMPAAPHEDTAADNESPPSDGDRQQQEQARVDADGIRFVVKQHLPQVHACYGRAFKQGSPGGRVEIGFVINQAGRAENVRTEVNTTDSAELSHCLEARVREWQYPRPVGGDYELIYPFVFAAGS